MEVGSMINLCNFQCIPKHNPCKHKPHLAYSMKAHDKGSNKVFTSWIISIWLCLTTSWDFQVKGSDGNVKFEGKIWCNFSLPCISLFLNKVKKLPIENESKPQA